MGTVLNRQSTDGDVMAEQVNTSGQRDQVRHMLRLIHVGERTGPFLRAAFSRRGLGSRDGRQLIRGKIRRWVLSLVPPVALWLQQRHGLSGGCSGCGASCNLLNACPHWEPSDGTCSVYQDRPNVCRLFPITPADVEDRDLVSRGIACGFSFASCEPVPRLITIASRSND